MIEYLDIIKLKELDAMEWEIRSRGHVVVWNSYDISSRQSPVGTRSVSLDKEL